MGNKNFMPIIGIEYPEKSIVRVCVFHPAAGLHQGPIEIRQFKGHGKDLFVGREGENALGKVRFEAGRPAGEAVEKIRNRIRRQFHGQHAAVEHVLAEDAGKAFGNDHVDTVDLEGERRLFYVAMTRAQNELILTRTYHPYGWYSRPFSGGGQWGASGGQNYFIEDLDEPLVRR